MPELEAFPNPSPNRNYTIKHICPEYTSVCPKTGQPDFATIELEWPMTAVAVSSLEFGLDAIVRESGSGADRRVVEITRLRGVGVFAARPHSTSMTTGEVAS